MFYVIYQNTWGEVTGAIPCTSKEEALDIIGGMVDEIAAKEGQFKDMRVYKNGTHIIETKQNKHRIQIDN